MPDYPMLARMGEELRAWRVATDLSQQNVADVVGWNRDAVSKLERGELNVSLSDYLEIVRFLRSAVPADHPGLALNDHLTRPVRRKRTG